MDETVRAAARQKNARRAGRGNPRGQDTNDRWRNAGRVDGKISQDDIRGGFPGEVGLANARKMQGDLAGRIGPGEKRVHHAVAIEVSGEDIVGARFVHGKTSAKV